MDLNNIVGFKAVDKNGNERQVTVDEMTELVSARIVSAASEISTFAAAAAAGTDEFEDQLPQSDTFSWLRTLDGSKNPTLTYSSAAAKVLGGLLGINDTWYKRRFGEITDFNKANNTGYMFVDKTQSLDNKPNTSSNYGFLETIAINDVTTKQTFVDFQSRFFIRICNNGTWTDWKQIQTT